MGAKRFGFDLKHFRITYCLEKLATHEFRQSWTLTLTLGSEQFPHICTINTSPSCFPVFISEPMESLECHLETNVDIKLNRVALSPVSTSVLLPLCVLWCLIGNLRCSRKASHCGLQRLPFSLPTLPKAHLPDGQPSPLYGDPVVAQLSHFLQWGSKSMVSLFQGVPGLRWTKITPT